MNQQNRLFGLLAQTSIHAGTGQNTGVIDLPIQRESHTQWPCIFSSAVKGALRTRAEQYKADKLQDPFDYKKDVQKSPDIAFIFGPPAESGDASSHAGSLLVSDARLLLLPVRSLTSQFKWVTCPAILKRLEQDMKRFGYEDTAIPELNPKEDEAIVAEHCNHSTKGLFLEEFRFNLDLSQKQKLSPLIKTFNQLMGGKHQKELERQLVIINNDNFMHLAKYSTPVTPHIMIENQSKTVKTGALWYEETLPPETLLYLGLTAMKTRTPNTKSGYQAYDQSAMQVMGFVRQLFTESSWLQIGGNETLGMGWCEVTELKQEKK